MWGLLHCLWRNNYIPDHSIPPRAGRVSAVSAGWLAVISLAIILHSPHTLLLQTRWQYSVLTVLRWARWQYGQYCFNIISFNIHFLFQISCTNGWSRFKLGCLDMTVLTVLRWGQTVSGCRIEPLSVTWSPWRASVLSPPEIQMMRWWWSGRGVNWGAITQLCKHVTCHVATCHNTELRVTMGQCGYWGQLATGNTVGDAHMQSPGSSLVSWPPTHSSWYPCDFTTVHKLDGFRFVSRWRDGRRCLLSEEERETLLVVFVTSKSLQYFTSYRGIPADTQNTAVEEMVRPGHVTTPAPLPPHRCFPQLLRFWWLQWDLLYINIPGCSQHNG